MQTELQATLWQALRGLYLQKSKPHPLQMQKAEGFASTIANAFTFAAEAEIMRHIGEVGLMAPEQYAAQVAEDEFEQQRRKPPRRALYRV
jgi:hypothetical protein